MQQDDRDAIADLFDRLRQVEERSGPRDPEAEEFIRSRVAEQPAAPYYMAQTIVVQNQALADAERRLAELEAAADSESGGLLSGLFGRSPGGDAPPRAAPTVGSQRAVHSDGFLAGAAQTAFGVAGGVLLANVVANSLFGADPSAAASGGESPDAAAEPDSEFDVGDFDIGF